MKRYPPHEWVNPRIEIQNSGIAGRGMFTVGPIRAGEMVIVWGGWVCTGTDVAAGVVTPGSTVYIDEDTYLLLAATVSGR